MKRLSAIAPCLITLLLGCNQVQASIILYNVNLSGAQSVPSNASPAFGSATVTVDDVANSVLVAMTFSGLTGGNATAAHIHCCAATNVNGPVIIPFAGFPSATIGTYSNLFTGVSAANIAGIESGLAYINIHNAGFPGGEIRGNILSASVPEPTSLSLIGAAVLALLGARRRRLLGAIPNAATAG